MLKINIKYNDYNDEECETEAYFNLNKMEMKRLAVRYPDGIQTHIDRMIAKDDAKGMMEMVEHLIRTSYGVRSESGGAFRKNQEDLDLFISSGAYDEYVFGLTDDPEAFIKFLMGVFPKEAGEAMKVAIANEEAKQLAKQEEQTTEEE